MVCRVQTRYLVGMLTDALTRLMAVPVQVRSALLLAVLVAVSITMCVIVATPPRSETKQGDVLQLPAKRHASIFFGPYAEMLPEQDGPLGIETVISREDWRPVGARYMSFGSVSDSIWLRARIENTSDAPITVRFDTRRVAFDQMSMYLVAPDGSEPRQFLDYAYDAPFSSRPINHRFLIADVELAPGEVQDAYVRFRGLFNTILPLRLASPEAFNQAEKHEVFWSAHFYGTFLAITFLTLAAAPLIGWRTSFSFGFFLVTSAATCLAVEGYVDQYVIPDKNAVTERLTDSLYFLTAAAILILSRSVFDLRTKARRIDSILRWTSYTILTVGAVHFLIGIEPRTLFLPIFMTLRGVSLILHAVVGVWAVWTQEKGSTAFAASSILAASASIALVVDPTFGYPYGGYPFIMRWLVTIEAMALAVAIIQNVLGIRQERDAAIQAELATTQERLRLSLALAESQKAYTRARQRAGRYMQRLETVSHDILQPLQSLRSTLQTDPARSEQQTEKLEEAFDYLEALARENLQSRDSHGHGTTPDDADAADGIAIATVIGNVAAMFATDAEAQAATLTTQTADQATRATHPVLLMRAISNLVSNSLKHTQSNEIIIAFEQDEAGQRISVRDQGPGMSPETVHDMLNYGARGNDSSGSGLGLAIVRSAAREMGASLDIQSTPETGTVATLILP